ncbi:MAG: hypothetical protein JOZ77_12670 [Candidatus Eremiobacteraeota bacterium]|nr:hypothetical protein [Candidatus Eremiobacteraeota bacterium]
MYAARDAKREAARDVRRRPRATGSESSAGSREDVSVFGLMFVIAAGGASLGLIANATLPYVIHVRSLTWFLFWLFVIAFLMAPAFDKVTVGDRAKYLVIIVVGLFGMWIGSMLVTLGRFIFVLGSS